MDKDDKRLIKVFEKNANSVDKVTHIMQKEMLQELKKIAWALGRIEGRLDKIVEMDNGE